MKLYVSKGCSMLVISMPIKNIELNFWLSASFADKELIDIRMKFEIVKYQFDKKLVHRTVIITSR